MKKLSHLLFIATAACLALCLEGCTDRVALDEDSHEDIAHMDSYVQFRLEATPKDRSMSKGTRATDGAYQDGDEFTPGVDQENRIDDIAFFLFHIHSWDAEGTSPCFYKGYIQSSDADWTAAASGQDLAVAYRLQRYKPTDDDRVIVVANVGDITTSINTLGQLRDYLAYQAWTPGSDITQCKRFVMSSSYNEPDNGRVVYSGKAGTKSDPYIATVNMQRTAARIDFLYDSDNVSGTAPYDSFDYPVYATPGDATSQLVARMNILNIIPLNVRQDASYLIRRVSAQGDVAPTAQVLYGGREYRDANGVPQNFVIEPHTLVKGTTQGGVSQDNLDGWFGATRANQVMSNLASHMSGTSVADYSAHVRNDNGQTFVTVAYANENTQPLDQCKSTYMTGILLRARYVPQQVWSDADASRASTYSFTAGRTFWRWTPEVTMLDGINLYFDNEAAATAFRTNHGGVVTKYTDGLCYYTLWIRHVDTTPMIGKTIPMEYAVVRNNIYRIQVNFVSGPGINEPVPWEPDEPGMVVQVKKWNKRVQPTIRL